MNLKFEFFGSNFSVNIFRLSAAKYDLKEEKEEYRKVGPSTAKRIAKKIRKLEEYIRKYYKKL